MNHSDQIYVFLVSVCCGALGGAVFDVFFLFRYPFRSRVVRNVSDVLFCLAFAAVYLVVSVAAGLPSLRFYACLGCGAGFALYLKSLHKFVAFFAEKLYNWIKHKMQKGKNVWRKGRAHPSRKKNLKKSQSAAR